MHPSNNPIGIGRHAAEGLAKAGFLVFAGVRKPQDADPLVAAYGTDRVVPLLLDVTDEEGIQRAVGQVEATLAKRGVKLVRPETRRDTREGREIPSDRVCD